MEQLDAVALRGMVAAGESALAQNVEAVNALNVFPVPDGDTGTNMLLTLRSVQEELAKTNPPDLSGVAASGARGALLGARGNSGVILSQFFAGLGRSFRDVSQADTPHVAQAFQDAAEAAYKAVSTPTEGTILTVMRATAEAMQTGAANGDGDLVALLERALEACRVAVLRTPEQLPVLREAGVVDAGGQGFSLILEGALGHLRGDDVGAISIDTVLPVLGVSEDFLDAAESMEYGYCTQVLIRGEALDPDDIRVRVSAMADSTVVVGDDTLVQVHTHTHDPGPILSLGVALGTLAQIKIENIDEQHVEFQAARRRERRKIGLAVVAVASGDGLEELFKSLGAHAVVAGGQTMNPSCQDLLNAVEALGAQEAVLLPNNSNVVLAARQAADLSSTPLRGRPVEDHSPGHRRDGRLQRPVGPGGERRGHVRGTGRGPLGRGGQRRPGRQRQRPRRPRGRGHGLPRRRPGSLRRVAYGGAGGAGGEGGAFRGLAGHPLLGWRRGGGRGGRGRPAAAGALPRRRG